MSQSGLNSPASMHQDSPIFSGSGVGSETRDADDGYLLWDQITPDPGLSMDGERRESPYETDMPVSVEANHSNTHTQEGNSDSTGGMRLILVSTSPGLTDVIGMNISKPTGIDHLL